MPDHLPTDITTEPPLGQLRWRCRRGTRELDRLLSGFLEHEYAGLEQPLRFAFVELLDTPDPLLQDWLLGRAAPPYREIGEVIALVRQRMPAHLSDLEN